MADEDLNQKIRSLFIEEDLERIDGLLTNKTLGSTMEEVVKTLVVTALTLPSVQEYVVRGWVRMGRPDGWIERNLQVGRVPNNRRILIGVKRDLGLIPESDEEKSH